jgi:isoleucyl-tRNA synthetase
MLSSQENYQKYSFNSIYQALLNFCINDLSAFYFEISKDSLYCDHLESKRRKQTITVLYYLLAGLLKVISPITPFLAEEVYENLLFKFGYANQASVMLLPKELDFPTYKKANIDLIEAFLLLREDVFAVLEKVRQTKIIHTNSQAQLLVIPKKEIKISQFTSLNLVRLLAVAQIEFTENKNQVGFYEANKYWIKVEKTSAARCIRC